MPEGKPEDLVGQLAALMAPCTFANGVMRVVVQSGETAIIRLDGNDIVVNDLACPGAPGATVDSVKRLEVVEGASRGNETVFLDYRNGLFARGSATASHGTYISIGGSAGDVVHISIDQGNDVLVAGSAGIKLDGDIYRDIGFGNVVALVNVNLGTGNDSFTGAGGGSAGNGLFNYPLRVWGGDGDDTLRGGGKRDELRGEGGNDHLTADTLVSHGADFYSGGADTDTITYASRTVALTISLDNVANDGATGEGDDVQNDLEIVIGGSGNDTITGGPGDETLNGGPGNDTLRGGDGSDTLNGEAGNDTFPEGNAANGADTFNGGAGDDVVDYSLRASSVQVSIGNDGDSDGEAGEGDRVGADVEWVIGGMGDDVLTGGDGNDRLTGGPGADVLNGGPGNDIFDEGATTSGGDIFNGGDGFDAVDYGARTVSVTITMGDGNANDGQSGENDQVGVDVERVIGSRVGDHITGSSGRDAIDAGDGADTIDAGAGDDLVNAEGGDDIISCGDGNDVAVGGAGNDTFADDCEIASQ